MIKGEVCKLTKNGDGSVNERGIITIPGWRTTLWMVIRMTINVFINMFIIYRAIILKFENLSFALTTNQLNNKYGSKRIKDNLAF